MSAKPHPLVDRVNRHLRKESSKSKKGQITAIEERSASPTEGAGPNLSHRLPQFPIASALLRSQIFCQEAHRLILPPLRGLVLVHFHTLTRCASKYRFPNGSLCRVHHRHRLRRSHGTDWSWCDMDSSLANILPHPPPG